MVNQNNRRFTYGLLGLIFGIWLAVLVLLRLFYGIWCWLLLPVGCLLEAGAFLLCHFQFRQEQERLEEASRRIEAYLDGGQETGIPCDEEGAIYRLFQDINTLASVLNAHVAQEQRQRQFLKNMVADISHQLKTPLAALNIYNGLLQTESDSEAVQQFASLSEQELDRMENLVQNLLKITRLDAGAVVMERTEEDVAELLTEARDRFACRADQEGKILELSGQAGVLLSCDRGWTLEAVCNLLKNALDHTEAGDRITIGWKQFGDLVQIRIQDTGRGIHPEDLPHIFKRFYRSRFSKDQEGAGLGLPIVKAVVEAQNGTIEVNSMPRQGTTFLLNFRIPAKL